MNKNSLTKKRKSKIVLNDGWSTKSLKLILTISYATAAVLT